jgi:pyrroloquinoline-quinone synthase
MDFWTSLEQIARRHDVLCHPFYQRWSAGELTTGELADYAGQYRHAVVALAEASRRAADYADADLQAPLRAHADEEAAHVALWDDFTAAVGGDPSAPANADTARCAAAWAGDHERPFLPTLVALYAIESAQPEISRQKREGLAAHYGIEGSGAAYFELHEQRDVEHAAAGRKLIEERLVQADHEPALREAERVLKANWELLDGVTAQQLAA